MLPPGPRTPAFWQTLRFMTAPRTYSRRVIARHGAVSSFRALNGSGIVVSDPDIAREVFATDPESFATLSAAIDVFGPLSVLATHGPTHKRQRRLLNPHFNGTGVKPFLTTMQGVVRTHLERLDGPAKDRSVVVMTEWAQALTLDVILETTFGDGDAMNPDEGRRVLAGLVHSISPATVFSRVLRSRFFPPWRAFLAARARFDEWVRRLMRSRRTRGELGRDVLGMLLAARYEDGQAMEDGEILDQLMAVLLAGHETTAVAIAWGVYWLAREPRALARLRGDLDALGEDPPPDVLTRQPYLGAVISETLRVEPIVSDVVRVCRKAVTLGSWTVPPGHFIAVNISAILADPALYPEPERFKPERFVGAKLHSGEFLPFGGGSRRCLGAAFAEAQLAIVLGSIAREWELALADQAPERAVRRNITLGPKRGVRVRVVGRRTARTAATVEAQEGN